MSIDGVIPADEETLSQESLDNQISEFLGLPYGFEFSSVLKWLDPQRKMVDSTSLFLDSHNLISSNLSVNVPKEILFTPWNLYTLYNKHGDALDSYQFLICNNKNAGIIVINNDHDERVRSIYCSPINNTIPTGSNSHSITHMIGQVQRGALDKTTEQYDTRVIINFSQTKVFKGSQSINNAMGAMERIIMGLQEGISLRMRIYFNPRSVPNSIAINDLHTFEQLIVEKINRDLAPSKELTHLFEVSDISEWY